MAPVTKMYGIAGPVPFLDVDVTSDNKWFVDPRAIRLHPRSDPFADKASMLTETFFDEVVECVLQHDSQRGLPLLQNFSEPWETRLGLSESGFSGHGGSHDVGTWLWRSLNEDLSALVTVGSLKQIEDLPMFIEGIDKDITSDITTRIIFEALTDFTAHMVEQYPEFTSGTRRVETFKCKVWDPAARDWVTTPFELPVADDKPLVLVPASWARRTLLMSAPRYYGTTVLGYVQLQRALRTGDEKLVPKRQLKTEASLRQSRDTNLKVTHQAHENDHDLIDNFKRFVDMKWVVPDRNDQRIA